MHTFLHHRFKVGQFVTVSTPLLYMGLLFGIPMFVFLIYSFWQLQGWNIVHVWALKNYIEAASNPTYLLLILRSIEIGLVTAVITVILSYPVAYTMVFRLQEGREMVLILIVMSLFSSYLVRVYAWKTILGSDGVINMLLMQIGLIKQPIPWLIYSQFAVVLTLTSVFVPLAILPIYSSLSNIHQNLLAASRDLGAGPVLTFLKVTLPLSMPGVISGFVFTFVLTTGDYVTPSLLGGSRGQMIGNAIVSQFGILSNWPLGSAITFLLVAVFLMLFGVIWGAIKISGLSKG